MCDPDRLVECAKFFRHHKPEATHIPPAFESEQHALECMKTALLFEAHEAMQDVLKATPEAPVSNAIDLETGTPGIAHTVAGQVVTSRSDDVVRTVEYNVGTKTSTPDVDHSEPPPKLTSSKISVALKAAERAAANAHRRAESKAAEAFMTPEQLQELNDAKKAERARKKAERAQKKAEREEEDAGKTPHDAEEEGRDAQPADDPEGAPSKTPMPVDPVELLQRVDPMGEEPRRPKRAKKDANDKDTDFYASPAPFDRHLLSLGTSGLHPSLRSTVLTGTPSHNTSVVITHGPPGCGKTHALLDALCAFHASNPDARCFVCAPTNVGAADLYARAFARGIVGCLALSRENMPPGVPKPRAVDLRNARFVFSTVAGRAGPRLDAEQFHAVFLDEAGLCPEAMMWGLLRSAVAYLWMVGDLKQLGAITSKDGAQLGHQRSMMERLVSIGVASTTLLTQRRMHPDICQYPNQAFYGAALITEQAHVSPAPEVAAYGFVDVRGVEANAGTSFENTQEAAAAVELALELKTRFPNTVILAPYTAQLQRIRAARCGVPVYTVDSYQGKEADAVVLTLVRTPRTGSGFWADERRLGVALTRARHVMRIVGHGGWAAEDGGVPLGSVVADAVRRQT